MLCHVILTQLCDEIVISDVCEHVLTYICSGGVFSN